MFYGQNCSGRFGDGKSIISVVGSKEDVNFVKLLNELKLKKIKQSFKGFDCSQVTIIKNGLNNQKEVSNEKIAS